MAVQHSELSPIELEFFADESKRVCLLHVMKGDRMMAEKVKLSSAEHPGVWKYFRCEVVFNQEIHLHYHQNICLYNLTNIKDLKRDNLHYRLLSMKLESQLKMIFTRTSSL